MPPIELNKLNRFNIEHPTLSRSKLVPLVNALLKTWCSPEAHERFTRIFDACQLGNDGFSWCDPARLLSVLVSPIDRFRSSNTLEDKIFLRTSDPDSLLLVASRKNLPLELSSSEKEVILEGVSEEALFQIVKYLETGVAEFINPRGQKVTRCAARQSQIDSREDYILEYEGFRARIDMAKPQQAGCHLLTPRVNNSETIGEVFQFAQKYKNSDLMDLSSKCILFDLNKTIRTAFEIHSNKGIVKIAVETILDDPAKIGEWRAWVQDHPPPAGYLALQESLCVAMERFHLCRAHANPVIIRTSHSLLLVASRDNLKTSEKEIIFGGISDESLIKLSEFFETGNVEISDEDIAIEIYPVAQKYQMSSLMKLCYPQLLRTVTSLNRALRYYSEGEEPLSQARKRFDQCQTLLQLNPVVIQSADPDSVPYVLSSGEKLKHRSLALKEICESTLFKGKAIFEGFSSEALYEIAQALETGGCAFFGENILPAYLFFSMFGCEELRKECLETILENLNSSLLAVLEFALDIEDKVLLTALMTEAANSIYGLRGCSDEVSDILYLIRKIYNCKAVKLERDGFDVHLRLNTQDKSEGLFYLIKCLFRERLHLTKMTFECNSPDEAREHGKVLREFGKTSNLRALNLVTNNQQVLEFIISSLPGTNISHFSVKMEGSITNLNNLEDASTLTHLTLRATEVLKNQILEKINAERMLRRKPALVVEFIPL